MRFLYLSILFVVAGCTSPERSRESVQSKRLTPERGVIFDREVERMFSQCSRYAPKPEGYWSPSVEQITALDTRGIAQADRNDMRVG